MVLGSSKADQTWKLIMVYSMLIPTFFKDLYGEAVYISPKTCSFYPQRTSLCQSELVNMSLPTTHPSFSMIL